ncbi:PilZ domain-containing protein [Stakelama sp. CBK3Z-3]|uniref:PilZ domain-containing protein n=1 Tax=Stakelama flava TaxID=2860338 RepID=A0ABS6XHE2_9SPHN|nr:PilZ domain-containing protein [Stakelama flava]MBW4329630.1 PilZ domain-containing protein [Stakelama flava]
MPDQMLYRTAAGIIGGIILDIVSDKSDAGTRERAPRHKLFEPATLRVLGQQYRCHILNLSRTGFAFHCDADLPRNISIVVTCRDHEMVARVRWNQAQRYGAQFVLPLADSTLEKFARR